MAKTLGSLNVRDTLEVPVLPPYQSQFGKTIVWRVADKNHTGYPENSVTLITDKLIQLMPFDAKEPSNSVTDRNNYGNNRYAYSNILQWLNSNETAGNWYRAQHEKDAPPIDANVWLNYNEYDNWAGFLTIFDPKFVADIILTGHKTARPKTDGGSYDLIARKMFLASTTEVGFANENGIAEGELLALFSDNESRVAYPTAECVSSSEYKNNSVAASKAWAWWLRTPESSSSVSVHYVSYGGLQANNSVYYGNKCVRPLCNLPSSLRVSDSPNQNGNYEIIYVEPPQQVKVPETAGENIALRVKAVDGGGNSSAYATGATKPILYNEAPGISGTDTDLGEKNESVIYKYTVTEPDGEEVTVTEAINGKTIRTYTPEIGTENTLTLEGELFITLPLGLHTITITATDSVGNKTIRRLTFTKKITGFTIGLAQPMEADAMPTRCFVTVQREMPPGSVFKVEACNNPFHTAPIWEDITGSVLAAHAHVFANKEDYALKHGLNLRVTVERQSNMGACWIGGIGGNFE